MKLLLDPLRIPIEELVCKHAGQPWRVKEVQDMADYASHPAAILSDGRYAVFAKFSEAANGLEQLELELGGLQLLAKRAGVLTPVPIGIAVVEGGAILVLEAVQAVERGPRQWREIGYALARIHRAHGEYFGLDTNCYFGPLPQDNRPLLDWPTFYAERRLRAGLRMAVDRGHLPPSAVGQIEKLITRVPALCGPEVRPTLLHGDAQQNNYISTAAGAVVIDPAAYYGHPEIDLAFIDYFQPVPDDVLVGYREELPIDQGFYARRELWRIWGYLAWVVVEGPAFMGKLMEAVRMYL